MQKANETSRLPSNLESMDDVFALPQALLEVLRLIDSEGATAQKLAGAVMHDPNLTAKILRMANSSYYRRGLEVSTVNQAIMMLGVSMVKCLALSVSIFKSDERFEKFENFDIREVYSHFLGVAIASREIATEMGYKKPEEAFVAGLLHDFGHLYFLKVDPDHHIPLIRDSFYDQDLIKLELEQYGISHTQIGRLIAQKWNLPECLRNAIDNHHASIANDTADQFSDLELIVMLADHINSRAYSDDRRDLERHIETVSILSKKLGVRSEFITELGFRLLNEIVDAAGFLGINIGDPIKLMQRANRELFESYVTIEGLFKERQELSKRVIEEEYRIGALKSKNIAIATLSHYINNAATIISGRTQLMQLMVSSGELTDPETKVSEALKVIETSLSKIMVVLAELKDLTSLDGVKFYNNSDAIDIDESVRKRMAALEAAAEDSEAPPDFD